MKSRTLWLAMFAANVALLGFLVFNLIVQTIAGDPLRGLATSGAGLVVLGATAVMLWRDRRAWPPA